MSIYGIDSQEVISLRSIAGKCHENMIEHGFHEGPLDIHKCLMMIVGELSEAQEELRNGHAPTDVYYRSDGKPEGFGVELSDAISRIMDLAAALGIDIGSIFREKHEYNLTRPYMHGGKKF